MALKISWKLIAGITGALFVVALAVALPVALTQGQHKDVTDDVVNSVLSESPIIDGHNDWPYQLRHNLNNSINEIDFLAQDFRKLYNGSHTDVQRLREGKVGAQFWSCFSTCSTNGKDAVRIALEQIDLIRRITQKNPTVFQFATTANEIEAANSEGKISSMIGVEGGHMIDSSLAVLRMLFSLGARYMTLTHSCDIPWATAYNTAKTVGLTDFGKLVVAEMNQLGMLVDLAHVSDATMNDVFDVTSAPVIFSHSSVRALCDHKRNVPDDLLHRLADNGGILMINFFNGYVTCSPNASVSDVADHFDYVRDLIGVDFLGIGADFDGIPYTPDGLEDVSKYPNLIRELLNRGWSEDELKKITGKNLLRVMRAVEAVAQQQQTSNVLPDETWISDSLVASDCRT